MADPKLLLTEFGIDLRSESCVPYLYLQREGYPECHTLSMVQILMLVSFYPEFWAYLVGPAVLREVCQLKTVPANLLSQVWIDGLSHPRLGHGQIDGTLPTGLLVDFVFKKFCYRLHLPRKVWTIGLATSYHISFSLLLLVVMNNDAVL